jgi:hypothetical protein
MRERDDDIAPLVKRLRADLRAAARGLGSHEIRYYVDLYYQLQEYRKAAANQRRGGADGEPTMLFTFVLAAFRALERSIRGALDEYTDQGALSCWAKSQYGIGPVITAGLAAHIDCRVAGTPGAIWRLAGLDPTLVWLGREKATALVADVLGPAKRVTPAHVAAVAARLGIRVETIDRHARKKTGGLTREGLVGAAARRPWNADLKVLSWKIAWCLWHFQARDDCWYGRQLAAKRAELEQANAAGAFAATAAATLQERTIREPVTRGHYEAGRLPPGRVHLRAMRWTVKLFLAHYWQVGREILGLPVPRPFAVDHRGHTRIIAPPGWPVAA